VNRMILNRRLPAHVALALSVLMPLAACAADVVLSPLAGDDKVQGELQSLSADTIVLLAAGAERTFDIKEVQSLEFDGPLAAEKPAVWLALIDGSSLAGQSYQAAQGQANVELAGGLIVQVPTRSIRHVRFREQEGELAEQWGMITKGEETSDLLVIRRTNTRTVEESGQEPRQVTETALDELDGTVLEVTPTSVKFEFSGDQLDVKREKIDGIVYFHPVQRQLPAAVARVVDAGRSVWSAKSIELKDDRLHVVSTAGVPVTLPLAQVAQIDFSSGNVAFLGDMEAESSLEDGSFQPRNMTATFKQLKTPRWITGGSQRPFGGDSLSIGGKKYSRGMSLSSRTRLAYRVPEGMRWFRAMAGLDDSAGPAANLTLVILADNREVYRQVFAAEGDRQPLPIELEVGTAGRWTIVVEDGSGLDFADQLDLAEARFTK
jgi:NPCBM/NEW2 domain-containing protein